MKKQQRLVLNVSLAKLMTTWMFAWINLFRGWCSVHETSVAKRVDVNVYVNQKQKLALHSSPMRDTVSKAVYGVVDMLRLLCHKNKILKSVNVLILQKKCTYMCWDNKCGIQVPEIPVHNQVVDNLS